MLGLIERLNHVRAIVIDAARGHRVRQARLTQLAREAGRTTAQHIAGYERQRRNATLVAIILELGAALTDQAIDLFERLVGTMFSKTETRHARAFQADGRAINEKVRLYARVGTALIAAREAGQDPFEAIAAVIPWERFRASVAEAGRWRARRTSIPTRGWASTMPRCAAGHRRFSLPSPFRAGRPPPRCCALLTLCAP
jgi:hypothetical protein